MASNVDILLRGHNQASGAIQAVKGDLTGLDRAAGGLAGGLGTLGKAFGALGVGMLAMQIGRGVVALGQMGEESAQMEARFTALVGGAAEATRQFQAMDAATGQWLTRDEKMESATRIMSLGLASSASEAANLARMAVMLGDTTQSATQRIDSFTQMLATGQTRGLTNFGISVITVRNRIEELRKANAGLSQEQATQQAIMEAAAAKMQMLGDYMPITQTQQMANATADLKDSLGDLVAQPYIVTVKFLTGGINQVTDILTARPSEVDALTPQMLSAQKALAAAQEGLAKVKAESTGAWDASLIAAWEQEVAQAQERVNQLAVAMAVTKAATDNASASMLGLGEAMAMAVSRTQETSEETSSLSAALDTLRSKDEAAKVNTVAMAIFRGEITLATAEALGLAAALALVKGVKVAPVSERGRQRDLGENTRLDYAAPLPEALPGSARDVEAKRLQAIIDAADKAEEEYKRANTAAANDYRQKMEAAAEAAASRIQGYLSQGMDFSIRLNDMRGGAGGLAPGQNGAFEDIYRLQAWLNDDSWADVGQKLAGGDKEKGRKIVEDFQRGIFSPEVIGAIDVDALAREAGVAALAEKSQAAFSKAIAEKAGTSTVVVDTLLGFKADDKGVKPMDTATVANMTTLAQKAQADLVKAIQDKTGTSTVVVDTLLGMQADAKGVKPMDAATVNAMTTLAQKAQGDLVKAIQDKASTSTVVVDTLLGFKADEKGVKPADTATLNAMTTLAAGAQKALAAALQDRVGQTSVVVDLLLGVKADEKGVKPADKAAENAMNTLAMSVGAQVKGKDFAGQMIGYGETIWGYAETGMVNKAKTSTAFQAAIDAMVAAAIAGALGQ